MNQVTSDAASGAGTTTSLVVTAPRPAHLSPFHELLSELNPLQYLPVVGTIYRAVTGDRIPEEARTVGSLVMSGLTGGPAGIAISAATLAMEKVTGIDPEKMGQSLLAELGLGRVSRAPPATVTAAPAQPAGQEAAPAQAEAAARKPARASAVGTRAASWSPAQLAAYGVTETAGRALQRGDVQGADVLNDLELARLTPKQPGAA